MGNRKQTVFHIQPDFQEALEDESFYINMDRSLTEIQEFRFDVSKNGTVFRSTENADDTFTQSQQDSHLYSARLGDHKVQFRTPTWKHTSSASDIGNVTSIDAFARANDVASYIVGNEEGSISLYDSQFSHEWTQEDAHCSEITTLKFFPSGEVVLSGSSDMQLKLWSIKDASCPRIFRGHTSKITDSVLIERGRDFVSSSLDGTMKLWECGSGSTVRTFMRRENPNDGINSMALIADSNTTTIDTTTKGSNLDFGTQGKKVVAGHVSGVITIHDILTKESTIQFPSEYMAPCNSISRNPCDNNYLYAGYETGHVALWDIRSAVSPVDTITINEGLPINSIYCHGSNKLAISSGPDTSVMIDLKQDNKKFQEDTPTYLVSEDTRISKFISDPTRNALHVVGDHGFWAYFTT
ncbi:hypothetical protein NCAS_0A06510 [Naumovozyma castellii]|uniref:Uncharacterized protein n=1 Tax=Naumovozyma castellii TaxID=27288 RepID=G0V6W2_NAUCA|nr:hypothetical protein NCAS_0A06510 [Naumovozyma castellii CBS 4309]CCC67209.1 hypothetical protein NCAS_0A06510 [Naumovozyma castellii CBS 4309]